MTQPLIPVTQTAFELETLSKAPIAEAILDIFVDGLEEIPMLDLKAFWEKGYQKEFPQVRERHNFKLESKIRIDPDPSVRPEASTEPTRTPIGYLFSSEDGLSVFQARRDGFTCNRLRPYRGWEEYREMARRIWSDFSSTFKPTSIKKISLRYVNNIQLPNQAASDYFTMGPNIPDVFPETFEHMLLQFKAPLPDLDASISCNFGFGPMTKGTFLLDLIIDSESVSGEEEMWSKFEQFRLLKNKYFRASITDKLHEDLK